MINDEGKVKHSLETIVLEYKKIPEDLKRLGFIERPDFPLDYMFALDEEGHKRLDRLEGSIYEHNLFMIDFIKQEKILDKPEYQKYHFRANRELKNPNGKALMGEVKEGFELGS